MANTYLKQVVNKNYEYGFVTAIESDALPPGLSEDIVREISRRKNEPAFMLQWRLRAYQHWLTMKAPRWAHLQYADIDYQSIIYYSSPKSKKDGPKSIEADDPVSFPSKLNEFRNDIQTIIQENDRCILDSRIAS